MRLLPLVALLGCHRQVWPPTPPDGMGRPTDTGETASTATTGTVVAGHTGPGHTALVPTGSTGHTGRTTVPTADTGPFAWPPEPVADVLVDCRGGGDFRTIQAAIDASVSGTHIGLAPCTYHGTIDYRGKSLDVFGLDGSAATILDGGGRGPVVTVARGESDGTRLAGVTITNGLVTDGGAAIHVDRSVLTLEDVVVDGNRAPDDHAVSADAARLVWLGGAATNNDVGATSEVVKADGGTLLLEGVRLEGNGARAALETHDVALVKDSSITSDGDYGWYVKHGEARIERTDVTGGGTAALWAEDEDDNQSENAEMVDSSFVGGRLGASFLYMDVSATNCVFLGRSVGLDLPNDRVDSHVHDSVLIGSQCGLRGDDSAYDVDWNLISSTCQVTGLHTIGGDPMFVAAPGDLHPAPGSPLVDAGDPDHDLRDADGTRNDLGRYGGPAGAGPP